MKNGIKLKDLSRNNSGRKGANDLKIEKSKTTSVSFRDLKNNQRNALFKRKNPKFIESLKRNSPAIHSNFQIFNFIFIKIIWLLKILCDFVKNYFFK